MTEITQEQQSHLEGFTTQRDTYLDEIIGLGRQRDSLSKDVLLLSTQHNDLLNDITGARAVLQSLKDDTAKALEMGDVVKKTIADEISLLKSKKDEASASLKETIEILSAVSKSTNEIKDSTIIVSQELEVIKKTAFDGVNDIVNGANEVSRTVSSVSNLVSEFHNATVAKEVENASKALALDIRETNLNGREQAMDETYHSVIEAMKRDGIKLTDLPQKQ